MPTFNSYIGTVRHIVPMINPARRSGTIRRCRKEVPMAEVNPAYRLFGSYKILIIIN